MEINSASSSCCQWNFTQAARTIIGGLLSPAGCAPAPTEEKCPTENNTPTYQQIIGPTPADYDLSRGGQIKWEVDGTTDYDGSTDQLSALTSSDLPDDPYFHDPNGVTTVVVKNSATFLTTKNIVITHQYAVTPTTRPLISLKGKCDFINVSLPLPFITDAGQLYYPDSGAADRMINLDANYFDAAARDSAIRDSAIRDSEVVDRAASDANLPTDAGIKLDAAISDAATWDSAISDAGRTDVRVFDGGTITIQDASINLDANQSIPDAAVFLDSAIIDAGLDGSALPIDSGQATDANLPVDAATPDAGPVVLPPLSNGCEDFLPAPEDLNYTINDYFTHLNTNVWHASNGYSNGGMFACGWRSDHLTFEGLMNIRLDNEHCPNWCAGEPYAAGEVASNQPYSYGLLQSRLTPVGASGIMGGSIFFFDLISRDEIDIEFVYKFNPLLGRFAAVLQTNYFTAGVGGHENLINLDFDPTTGFHEYAIKWIPREDGAGTAAICWYVDRALVQVEDGSRGELPINPGRIMMNLWPGNPNAGAWVSAWLGELAYAGPYNALYSQVSFTSF